LDEIFDYIMVDNPSAADSILESIMHALSRLENFPHSGTPLLDVLHGARNYTHLLIKELK
ncbi:type II toxin-antitoxin system RelE/ParE family toxin, partial [Carboxydocella sp. JDF658]|uniref:type II toxin-antitoxin system RelE/ParE family toxin n=1 Tax=Carboxydocella sp. JDF658 TaxID=1926600 RepID=UPI0009D56294